MAEFQGTITLASVSDGTDGSSYFIESNYENIYRLYPEDEVSFSPGELIFSVTLKNETKLEPERGYYYDIGLVTGLGEQYEGSAAGIFSKIKQNILDELEINDILFNDSNSVTFNINTLLNKEISSEKPQKEFLDRLKEIILLENVFFTFDAYQNEQKNVLLVRKVFGIINSVTNSLATFSTTATSINAAVRNSRMNFDAGGLHIYNGAFDIYGDGYQLTKDTSPLTGKVYYTQAYNQEVGEYEYTMFTGETFDPNVNYYEQNNLPLLSYSPGSALNIVGAGSFTGNIYADGGYFKGELQAASGSFIGNITAESGTIGGFNILEDRLESNQEQPNIILYGSNGAIYANDITLGEFAKIESYIQLGSNEQVKLYNPDWADNSEGQPFVLKVDNNVYLTAEGILNLNKLVFDGKTSTIKGVVEGDPNFGWASFEINPTKAYFPNVDVSGKITTAIFEKDHVQSVGGSILFKPSYKIENTRGEYAETEDSTPIEGKDYYIKDENDIYIYVEISEFEAGVVYYERKKLIFEFSESFGDFLHEKNFEEYVLTRDTEFISGKTYYEKDENDNYFITEDEEFNPEKTYYELKIWAGEYVIFIDSDGSPSNCVQVETISTAEVVADEATEEESSNITIVQVDWEKLSAERKTYISMIILGEPNDVIIGINSSNGTNAYMQPRGITISEFDPDKGTTQIPRVFLGDFSQTQFSITGVDKFKDLGYGLYSNNVILNGSLTTQYNLKIYYEKDENDNYFETEDEEFNPEKVYYERDEEGNYFITEDKSKKVLFGYAGINTIGDVHATKFNGNYFTDKDTSRIVFWGGAENINSIANSPFQVTEKGSIYASNGLFEGVIISRSKIYGADIFAIRIHGAGKDTSIFGDEQPYGLAFFDVKDGILFKTGGTEEQSWNDATTLFGIGSDGLYVINDENYNYFITIDNNIVNFSGNNYNGANFIATGQIIGKEIINKITNTEFVNINDYKISYYTEETNKVQHSSIHLNESAQYLSLTRGNSTQTSQLKIGTNIAIFTVDELNTNKDFRVGISTGKNLYYTKVSNGYDLYI